jgi:hypothetical protein
VSQLAPRHKLSVDKDREFRCDECGNRCTRGRDGTEYGHARGYELQQDRCSRRPDSVDPGREFAGNPDLKEGSS